MTSICLIRHGETDWNSLGKLQGRTDISLNCNGVLQAKECSQFLKGFQWDAIITSPLKRAKETAEIINNDLSLPLIEMDEFIERSFGDAEGMTIEERLATFPNRNYRGQESRESINKRIISGINAINQEFVNKKVLLVPS